MAFSDDFARWQDDPMTRMVLTGLKRAADEQKAQWDAASWGGAVVRGDDLARLLQELRVRADAYSALAELTAGDLASWLDMELTDEG